MKLRRIALGCLGIVFVFTTYLAAQEFVVEENGVCIWVGSPHPFRPTECDNANCINDGAGNGMSFTALMIDVCDTTAGGSNVCLIKVFPADQLCGHGETWGNDLDCEGESNPFLGFAPDCTNK